MKLKPRTIAYASLLGLLLPFAASAYYSPEQGRWISRDPIDEAPMAALTRREIAGGNFGAGAEMFGHVAPVPSNIAPNTYWFIENGPTLGVDYLGLMTEPGLREWQKCSLPKRWRVKLVGGEIPKADGCSVPSIAVPKGGTKDDPTGLCSFEEPCNNHDYCYSDCKRTRVLCDEIWGREMHAACDRCAANMARGDFFIKQFLRNCHLWAARYKSAVEKFGDPAYEARQKKNCECVCTRCENPYFCPHPNRNDIRIRK